MNPLTPPRRRNHTPIITDTFTRYTELIARPDKETTTVAKTLLDHWILRHGFYEQTISDHGGESAPKITQANKSKEHTRSYGRSTDGMNRLRKLPKTCIEYMGGHKKKKEGEDQGI